MDMINAIGRLLPGHVGGYGRVVPFAGAFAVRSTLRRHAPPVKAVHPGSTPTFLSKEPRWKRGRNPPAWSSPRQGSLSFQGTLLVTLYRYPLPLPKEVVHCV